MFDDSGRSKANLISHNKIHEGDKRFICRICDKGFLFKQKVLTYALVDFQYLSTLDTTSRWGLNIVSIKCSSSELN